MNKEKVTKMASIVVGLILAIVLVIFGVRVLQNRAGRAEVNPDNVRVEGANQNGFTVTFSARKNLDAKLDYDTECKEDANLFATCTAGAPLDGGDVKYECPVTLASLDTTYYFIINAGGKTYDNSGTCFQAKTLGGETSQSTPDGVLTPRPTRVPTAMPKPTLPPAATVTDCGQIQLHIGEQDDYTAFAHSQCIQRTTVIPTPTP